MNCVAGNAKLLANGGNRHAALVALDGLLESLPLNQSIATSHASAFKLGRNRYSVPSKAGAEFGKSCPGQVGLSQLVELAWSKSAVNFPRGLGNGCCPGRKGNLEDSFDPFSLVTVV